MRTPRPPLRDALADYLSLRRALGFQLANAGRLLDQFVGYLQAHGVDTVTTERALAWATLPAGTSAHWWAIRISVVRGFAAYLHSLDPSVEVPPAGVFRTGPCRATPYLYSQAEIRSLIEAAGALRPRLRAGTYQSLISLLAISGIRIGEAIALDDDDFDVEHELLVVRHTKFNKHRLVPLHPSATRALTRYVELRQRGRPRPAASPALFVSTAGTRLLHSNVNLTFARLVERVGLTRHSASCRPRIHDLRHSFAVATVLGWYRDGADIPALMPRLSAYLGHSDPQHTFWYLSAAPELMALAGKRLEAHLGGEL